MSVEVRGWMREDERAMLRRLAFGKSCLEVGSYCGLSTSQIATTAKGVLAVDTFDGMGTIHHGEDTEEAFWNTMRGTGVADKVRAIRGLSSDVLPKLKPGAFDFIFIDGSHDYESVKADARMARPLLKADGVLAFHDVSEGHPGVCRVVQELLEDGGHAVEQCSSLAALQFSPVATAPAPVVALLMPHRDCIVHLGSAFGCWKATERGLPVVFFNRGTSVLTQNFNTLLADALNARVEDGVTHVAMLHNDIIPQAGWLDVLLEEMQRTNVEMIAAVAPLKNGKGLTSTGLDTPGDPWSVRRLTMTEVFDLPETFTAHDCPLRMGEGPLLLNTGCWLMKLTEPWIEGMHFRQEDRMAFNTVTRKYAAQSISEDWLWSRDLHARGCRLAATRKVGLQHERAEFHNRGVWGQWTTDEAYLQYLNEIEAAAASSVA
jgi:hypothetical protein